MEANPNSFSGPLLLSTARRLVPLDASLPRTADNLISHAGNLATPRYGPSHHPALPIASPSSAHADRLTTCATRSLPILAEVDRRPPSKSCQEAKWVATAWSKPL